MSDAFSKKLGYEFRQPKLLEQALTHPSFGPDNYQRLEFLGDRVLGIIVADMLYRHFPEAAEGELSRRFTMLVREPTLADIGREWDLEGHVRLGAGEALKQAILADVVEAILGAIHADGGAEAVQGLVETAWKPYLERKDEKDPKSRLQELVQGGGNPLPEYVVIAEEGPDHNKNFTVEVRSALGAATGQGVSKQVAGAAAAAALLVELEK